MGDTLSANPGIMDSASSFNSTLDRCEFWSSRERIREISYPNLPKKGALHQPALGFSPRAATRIRSSMNSSSTAIPHYLSTSFQHRYASLQGCGCQSKAIYSASIFQAFILFKLNAPYRTLTLQTNKIWNIILFIQKILTR